jgi:guanylate kinase
VVAVIGPSGAGKTTLVRALVSRRPDLCFVPTWTTRAPRHEGEFGHVFTDPATFARQSFLGTLEIFGAVYGMPPWPDDRTALLLLRVPALGQLRALFPEARIIQVEAPVGVLLGRLAGRGDTDRADAARLEAEMAAGRPHADAIVDADADIAAVLARFEAAVDGTG